MTSRMRETSASKSSASTSAVDIFVAVLPLSFAAKSSHLDLVRLAMTISPNTSLFMQHLRIATEATPPQPMIKTFAISLLLYPERDQQFAHDLACRGGRRAARVVVRAELVDVQPYHVAPLRDEGRRAAQFVKRHSARL